MRLSLAALLAVFTTAALQAQGVLTITPGRSAATTAGTGAVGYSGNGGAATSATLASPAAVAYDTSGNLYIADANNHVVREVAKSTGVISVIAGSGQQGFGGDGGAATSAYLDTPTGVAVDGKGNVYIADSHNNRIREVSNGNISTIAGTGTAGFGGDGGAATSAQLALPSAVAVDATGNLYIADTNNHRIRKVAGTTITTIAGDGEEVFAGDGGAATAAALDSPAGVAVDSNGNVYIADSHNQRVRMVNASGAISTLAGSGTVSFAGGYSGDGASATAATLAKPTGVSVDAAGNVYVADTNNQRIRQVGGSAIGTIAGTGAQDFYGDGGAPTSAAYNSPRAVTVDSAGDIAIADTQNQRIRGEAEPSLSFTGQAVGVASAPQTVTLANTGSASLTVSSIALAGPFAAASGGTCSATPITLAAGTSCTQNLAFLPLTATAATGSVTFSGTGVVPQSILLAGTGLKAATTTSVSSSLAAALFGQPVTFTATVSAAGSVSPTGTVSFYDGSTLLGTAQTLTGGAAALTLSSLGVGTHSITAAYSGDSNFNASTSTPSTPSIVDFSLNITSGSSTSQTVLPGNAATYNFTMQPIAGPLTFPVTLTASGLPPGATVSFNPATITAGATPVPFTMTIQTTTVTALHQKELFGSGMSLAVLLLPFAGRLRRGARRMRPALFALLLVLGAAAATGLTGCGSGQGFFGQQQQTYTIQVVGTATGPGGLTLQHSTSVTLTVQ